MHRMLMLALSAILFGAGSVAAREPPNRAPVSQCQAVAQSIPGVMFASFNPSDVRQVQATAKEEVAIQYIGHSTFLITSPEGVTIATDYNGVYRPPVTPDVVTMNKAHSTHYTLTPDPAIKHVLHGWSDVPGEKAEYKLQVGDVYIRNVTSDIRNRWGGGGLLQKDGNSIFIFEVAGLCIGHLGHLHYELTETQYAEIGRLDVLMVPVDGGLTMGTDSMSRIVKRLRSALILPMHQPSALEQFLVTFGAQFKIAYASDPVIRVSMRNLPRQPQILVPQGM
ncbi:MBL fold metallo-hydrolase [Agrobacterium larrymoorei]|uniref:MBL fold metallo-hydrolase n=1 Tax=Agrobacterium larrymoorei TaxID=160699 RepID=A0AAF0H9L3_9HYPH|nr:MBL fold metallo-hydrolase [Agrobacterium larrymoorei]WHA41732.1 MBL fold metallo-hydrolase [Agrobacterium larrymoorei]